MNLLALNIHRLRRARSHEERFHNHDRSVKLHTTCGNTQTLIYVFASGVVRMLVKGRRRGRGRSEDVDRGTSTSVGELKSSCYRDRPCSVQKTELPSSTASISTDRPMKVDWAQDRTASNRISLVPTRQRKNPIRLFDCALINVVHGRE